MRRILLVLLTILPVYALAFDREPASRDAREVVEREVADRDEAPAVLEDDIGRVALVANDMGFLLATTATVDTAGAPAFVAPDDSIGVPGVPEDDISQLVGLIPQLVQAVNSKQWDIAIAIGLMLAVFVVRRFFLKQVPPESTKWVVLGLSLTFKIATGLVGGLSLLEAIIQGITTALMTVGAWEFGGKKPLKKALPSST